MAAFVLFPLLLCVENARIASTASMRYNNGTANIGVIPCRHSSQHVDTTSMFNPHLLYNFNASLNNSK
jgi:hypothetical protein